MHYIKCKCCRKGFYAARLNTRYCSDACRKEAKSQRDAEKYEEEKKSIKKSSLTEVNRMAREAGMSYGKFVAMKYIEEHRNDTTV